jgi:hypothetical protein
MVGLERDVPPPIDKDEVDVLCIYCPDTGACYYVDPKVFGTSISLRVRPSRNGQSRNVLIAERFRKVPGPVLECLDGSTPPNPSLF